MMKALARTYAVVQRLEEWALAVGVLVIGAVTIANVFCRAVLNDSLSFAEELAQFLIIVVTFLGLSYAAGKGRHIRMSAAYDQLDTKGRKLLMSLIAGSSGVLMFLMGWYAVRYVATVHHLGTVSAALQVPLYIVYCAAPLGFFLAGIQYTLTLVRNLTADDVFLSYETKDEYEEPDAAGV